ncbi:hypothetical protein [Brucella anthropi]|uniref:hypothetical protein n=1 Tax=Brucella anthropi TaxID=529 RepID=UPI001E415179|nr:hypothetical protein [Brucella anthropi]UGQ21729.1 hypothetical protein LRL11_03055 [Brucella anthropi]
MKVAIGVVLYETPQADFERWYASFEVAKSYTDVSFNVVVIDNSPDLVSRPPKESITQIPGRGNIGFGAGHNALIETSVSHGFDYYIGVNPDGFFHRYSLQKILERVQREPSHLYEFRQFPLEHPKNYDIVTGETAWCSGAAFCFSAEAYRAVGGFDESFFMYCEDVDLSWRYRLHGRKCLVAQEALYYHSVANRDESELISKRMLSSGVLLARKWRNTSFEKNCLRQLEHFKVAPPDEGVANPLLFSSDELAEASSFNGDFTFSDMRWRGI